MRFGSIPTNALFGIFRIRKLPGNKYDSYYRTVNLLSSLLCSNRLLETIAGFYLNHVPLTINDHTESVVRISYFVSESRVSNAQSMFREFLLQNDLSVANEDNPRSFVLAENYGGSSYEERYRNFLNLQTRIGLELINADLLQAKCLIATYRWQVRKAGLPVRAHFEPTFARDSSTYNALSSSEKEQFFVDLQEWPNPTQVDWAHFMVNLVLGADWNYEICAPSYLTPGQPLSIPEINVRLKELEFQIPLDWEPR